MSLLITGGSAVDIVYSEVPRMPNWANHTEFTAANLELLRRPPLVTLGGNGANAAYVAARCGARVILHTNLGTDSFGDLAAGWLRTAGCRVSSPRSGSAGTAVNVTATNRHHQRATLYYSGQSPTLPPSKQVVADWALVCGWPHPPIFLLQAWAARLRILGTRLALDVGPLLRPPPRLTSLRALLEHLDLLLGNEYELCALARARTARTAMRRLRAVFDGDVIMKCGPHGAAWLPAGAIKLREFSGVQIKAVNTIGAGDSFNGALLAVLDRGDSIPLAIPFANHVAASVVASDRGVIGVRVPNSKALAQR